MEYDISPDERRVAFTIARDGVHEIWIAALDRQTPPARLVRGGDEPEFGGDYVFFSGAGNLRARRHVCIRVDGSGESQLLPDPISEIFCAAPDGRAIVVEHPNPEHIADAWVVAVDGTRQPQIISKGYAPSQWSRDGRTIYVGLNVREQTGHSGWTQALPVGADDMPLSALPAESAGAVLIPHQPPALAIGPDPSVYVFLKSEQRQNIYRIPLH